MEELIKKYVQAVITDPLLNLYRSAIEIFGENPLPGSETNLVVPELAEIPTTKRKLIQDIVYDKTKYRIAVAKDAFMENIVLLADKSEAQQERS